MLRNSPYLLLIIATAIWGGNFVAGKWIVTQMPPFTMAAVRWSIALVCFIPFLGKSVWEQRAEWLRSWKTVVFLGLTGVAGFNTFTYIAVQYTDSINASLMNSATPILVVILTWFMLKESIVWSAIPGIVISMLGVFWIIGRGDLAALAGFSFNPGDLWMLVAVLLWAFYSVGVKKTAGRFAASPLLFVQIIVALIVLIPLSAAELTTGPAKIEWSGLLVVGLLYIGLFASIIAFLSWNRAIELLGPQRCAGFLNLIPLFSAIFASLFAGESIKLYHLAGAALIVSGVYAANRMLRKRSINGAGPASLKAQTSALENSKAE